MENQNNEMMLINKEDIAGAQALDALNYPGASFFCSIETTAPVPLRSRSITRSTTRVTAWTTTRAK